MSNRHPTSTSRARGSASTGSGCCRAHSFARPTTARDPRRSYESMRTAACASMNGRGIRQEWRPARLASVSPLPRSDSRMQRAMMQRFEESTHPSFGTRHVPLIREAMKGQGVDAWIVPHTDEYQNEYLPACNERLAWATGFTGSAGAAVIFQQEAAIFVDGRYTLQVRDQVDTGVFEIRHLIDDGIAA